MKHFFKLFLIAIALIAATFTSCKKEIKFDDVTENTFTIRVTDYRSGEPIVGAEIKGSEGEVVATTSSDGMATYTKKANDMLLFTVNANGYASMIASNNVTMHKLNAKVTGIATYTNKQGDLKTVPSGTQLTVVAESTNYVQRIYKTNVSSDGKFEFTSLPDATYMYFESPTKIGNDMYSVSSYYSEFYAGYDDNVLIQYSYINNNIPFTVITRPGTVKPDGSIVMVFNKEADPEYYNNYFYIYNYYDYPVLEWSNGNKTLTIKPAPGINWGTVGNTFTVEYGFYTPVVDGQRESTGGDFNVNFNVRITE